MGKTLIIPLAKAGLPVKDTSHQLGWLRTWQHVVGADVLYKKEFGYEDIAPYERILIYNDMNSSSKALNYPGGCSEIIKGNIQGRVEALTEAKQQGVRIAQTDYNQMFKSNLSKRKDTADLIVPDWMDEIQVVDQTYFNSKHTVIGDSHSISITPEGWSCNRNDGQTLRGALKKGLASFMTGEEEKVMFSFGDIDLRFHFGRQEQPYLDIQHKLDEYHSQVLEIQQSGVEVMVKEAMPQMPDSRKLPGSGQFKEKGSKVAVNFNGPLVNRMSWTKHFNSGLRDRFGSNTICFDKYRDEYGMLDMKCSEGGVNGRSVHLAPHSYNNEVV